MEQEVQTVTRAVTIPVAAPVGLDWKTVDRAISPTLNMAVDLANWLFVEIYLREPRPFPRDGKMPPYPFPAGDGLYRHAFGCTKQMKQRVKKGQNPPSEAKVMPKQDAKFPQASLWRETTNVMGGSAVLVVRNVERAYKKHRFDILRRAAHDLLRQRSFPFPFHNKHWRLELTEQGPLFTATIPGHGPMTLRLRQGRDFARQLAMLGKIVNGTAKKGEAAIYRNHKGRLHVKIVGTFPARLPDEPPINACFLHTDPGALLVAEVNGRKVSITNGDHIRREVAKHKTFRQRASEDKKPEVRMDRRQRANFNKVINARCRKQHDRVDTAIHQITAQVVRFCERQRVGVVVYDDHNSEFIPEGFAWYTVGERLADKLRAVGITFLARKDLKPEEFDEWRTQPSLVRATALAGKRLVETVNRKGSHPSVTVASKSSRNTVPTCRTRRSPKSSPNAATSPSVPPAMRASSSEASPRQSVQ